mgnify:CR=1 FL=1
MARWFEHRHPTKVMPPPWRELAYLKQCLFGRGARWLAGSAAAPAAAAPTTRRARREWSDEAKHTLLPLRELHPLDDATAALLEQVHRVGLLPLRDG